MKDNKYNSKYNNFLEITNRHSVMDSLLAEFIGEVKNISGCTAIGIRVLDDVGNIPYLSNECFSQSFFESENPLNIKSHKCLCINVILGERDQDISYFSPAGSFYTNSTTYLLDNISDEKKANLRSVCNQVGYESVALIPIRLGGNILGLIHLADQRENMLSLEMVETLERASLPLGIAIQRIQDKDELARSERELGLKKRINDIFLNVPDKKMYVKVLRLVSQTMESESGLFGYIDNDGALVCPSVDIDFLGTGQRIDNNLVFSREARNGHLGRALNEKTSICINETFDNASGCAPVNRCMIAPIVYHNQLVGAISVVNKASDYNPYERSLLENVANHIAPVLNARLQRARDEVINRQYEEKIKLISRFPSENPSPVLRVQEDGLIIFANNAAQSVLSSWERKVGQFVPDEWQTRIKSVYCAQQKQVAEIIHKERVFSLSIVPVPHTGYINFYGEDITERKRVEAEVSQYREHLENLVEKRTAELKDKHKKLLREIEERKRAQEIVRKSEAQLKKAQQIACLGHWELDLVHNELTWSDELYRIFGVQPQEFGASYEAFLDMVHPEDRAFVDDAYNQSLKNKKPYNIIHRLLLKDGTIKYVNEQCVTEYDRKGTPLLSLGTTLDVTRRIKTEEALKKALSELKKLKNQLQAENIYLQDEIKLEYNFEDIIGKNSMLRKVLGQLQKVASTDSTVLILGETGTGKELIARAIHNISPRNKRTLVKVNCAAIPATLIESELFGHEKGAFTGADSQKIGRFELADAGTIFLDEIGDMPLELQSKLLRVIQEGELERVGNARPIKVNVRVIAATNKDLQESVAEGSFRQDLYYRLNVFPLRIPPLRERKDDIPLLVNHFVNKCNLEQGKKITVIPLVVMNALQNYPWPGNVRELQNIIERAVILSDSTHLSLDNSIGVDTSFSDSTGPTAEQVFSPPLTQAEFDTYDRLPTLKENERAFLLKALKESNWKIEGKSGAAIRLNIAPSTLRHRMKRHGIKRPH